MGSLQADTDAFPENNAGVQTENLNNEDMEQMEENGELMKKKESP